MKKLLVLAGGSARNQVWGDSCAEFFKKDFDITWVDFYDHWQTGESHINFEAELEKIKFWVEESNPGDTWYIYAKSIGSILALKAVQAGILSPVKCVFFGMPFSVVKDTLFKDDWSLLENFMIPALAFHNDNDPTAEYGLAKEKITTLAPSIAFETLKGDNHDYLDFAEYEARISEFVQS
jgi:hypothetical protein